MNHERWKMVAGSERVAVSDHGRLFSFATMRILDCKITKKGYVRVSLGNKKRLVHRLVAEAFLPKPTECQVQINHKNGCKTDNRMVNLEWCTASENLIHSYRKLGRKAAMQGKHWDSKTKAKMSEANKNRVFSEEWRRKNSESHKGKNLLGDNPRARETICLETGEIFSCAVEAAIKMGLEKSLVYQSIRNHSCVAGKWHFSYTEEKNNDKNK